jgi:hypothetical protein
MGVGTTSRFPITRQVQLGRQHPAVHRGQREAQRPFVAARAPIADATS